MAKREAAGKTLSAEVNRLARLVPEVCPGATEEEARAVLVEVLTAFPVYRAYVHPGESPSAAATDAIAGAVACVTTCERRPSGTKRIRLCGVAVSDAAGTAPEAANTSQLANCISCGAAALSACARMRARG